MSTNLNYFSTGTIHLDLEDYYKAGMTSEEAKNIIESVPDILETDAEGSPQYKFRCKPIYINHNWKVNTQYTHPDDIEALVLKIKQTLDQALEKKNSEPE